MQRNGNICATQWTVFFAPLSSDYIPGGSSSGAAVSVSAGLVSFAFGTDTGGSGRIPAGFNNIVGLKPTLGLLSRTDMTNACRTLDTVSIFALRAPNALEVLKICTARDPRESYGRAAASPRYYSIAAGWSDKSRGRDQDGPFSANL